MYTESGIKKYAESKRLIQQAMLEKQLVLFVGAGASVPSGIDHLHELYKENDGLIKRIRFNAHYYTCNRFCERTCSVMERLAERISEIETEFEDKRTILQHLVEYKNSRKTWILSILMCIIAALTLFFVIFPSYAGLLANWIKNTHIAQWIK